MPLGHGELQLAMELHGRGAGTVSHRWVLTHHKAGSEILKGQLLFEAWAVPAP